MCQRALGDQPTLTGGTLAFPARRCKKQSAPFVRRPVNRLGNALIAVGESLKRREGRRRLYRRLRRLHRWLAGFCLTVLLVFLLAVGWIGERNIFTAFFLFLPGQVWLLPLAACAGASLLMLDWKLLGVVLLGILAHCWLFLGWEISGGKSPEGGRQLTVMTFNRGQRGGSLRPFKDVHRPDILAMQEAAHRSGSYLKAEGYGEFTHGEDIGEFMLLSRFPIRDKGLVRVPVEGGSVGVAAWFSVDFEGEEIVVYNVHLPTPREQLLAFRRGAFLRGLWPFSAAAKSYQAFWDRQIVLAEGLLAHIATESRPVIVVGDFNTPDKGYIYRLLCRQLRDSHEEAGAGFGWTFPGHTRNPLSLCGPLLRIDHQFAGSGWRVLESTVEPPRKSQHLAVAAKFERATGSR